MDIRKVKKLIEMMQESDISEIEVRDGEDAVKIKRGHVDDGLPPSEAVVPIIGRPRLQAYASLDGALDFVRAPSTGVFYRSLDESMTTLQRLGEIVAAGDQLGAIKSGDQKVPILAEEPGLLMAMLTEDGALVTEGDCLFQIRKS